MTKLSWGTVGERFYETGTDRGVLYLDGVGVAWNGLISVTESPSGGEPTPYYLDGVKYLNITAPEEFESTIEAYTYPDEFAVCDGTDAIANGLYLTQQDRKPFGLVYRTRVGNDIEGSDHGYKLHIVYNATASPSSRKYNSASDNPDLLTFSWKVTTTNTVFQDAYFGLKYGSHLVIDSRTTYPAALAALEEYLYGTDTTPPRIPTPLEILALFEEHALLRIKDNGDGTWTATGPDEAIQLLNNTNVFTPSGTDLGTFDSSSVLVEDPNDPGTYIWTSNAVREDPNDFGTYLNDTHEEFQISWPSAIMLDADTYTISSL